MSIQFPDSKIYTAAAQAPSVVSDGAASTVPAVTTGSAITAAPSGEDELQAIEDSEFVDDTSKSDKGTASGSLTNKTQTASSGEVTNGSALSTSSDKETQSTSSGESASSSAAGASTETKNDPTVFNSSASSSEKSESAESKPAEEKPKTDEELAETAAQKRADKLIAKAKSDGTDVEIKVKGNTVIKTYPNGRKVVQTVNKNGKLSKQVVTEGEDENYKKVETQYDENGKKLSRNIIKGKGKHKTCTDIEYKDGKKVAKTVTGKSDGKDSVIKCEYNDNEQITKRVITRGEGKDKEEKTYEYSYNSDGQRESKTIKYPNGKVRTAKYSDYKTDSDGNVTREASFVIKDADGNEIKSFNAIQTLNKDGKVKEAERFDNNGNKIRDAKKEFDENGNLSSKEYRYYNSDGSQKLVTYSNFKQKGGTTICDIEIITKDSSGKTISKQTKTQTRYFDGNEKFSNEKTEKE